jgi:hypothetical protein
LISVRKQSIKDINDSIIQITSDGKSHIDSAKKLEKQIDYSLKILPKVFDRLFGNETHLKIEQIMTSYDSMTRKVIKSCENQFRSITAKSRYTTLSEVVSFSDRCRMLLREIDRVHLFNGDHVASALLHATPQIFPKKDLKDKLQIELKKMMYNKINEEELEHPLLRHNLASRHYDGDCDSINTFDSGNEEHTISTLDCNETDDEISAKPICEACETFPCQWNASIDVATLNEKRNQLSSTVMTIKQERFKLSSNSHDDDVSLSMMEEEIRKLTIELQRIDEQLKLAAVDKELHDSYNSTSKYFVVRSLHGYDSLMHRSEAKDALSVEHDRLVAILVSKETIDDILDR